MNNSRRELIFCLTVCTFSPKLLLKRARKFHYRNPKLKKKLQRQKTNTLLIAIKSSLNIQRDNFVLSSDLKSTNIVSFLSRKLKYTAIILFSPKLSTLTIAKIANSTTTDNILRTSVISLAAVTMYCAFTPDCRYDNSSIKLFKNVYCPKTMCSGALSDHKKTLQSLGRSNF